jgi:type IV pilus assembly protein PilC
MTIKLKPKVYYWRGQNKAGERCAGTLTASTLMHARVELRQRGVIVKRLTRYPNLWLYYRFRKAKSSDITLFSRQLATLIHNGIPLTKCLEIIQIGQSKQTMKNLLMRIKDDLERGVPLNHALKKHPSYFNSLYCALIEAGERSGALSTMLDKVARYKENLEANKRKIKKILTYPIIITVLALLMTLILLIFVIPQFITIFKSFQAELPFMTVQLIKLSNFCQRYYLLFTTIALLAVLMFSSAKKIPRFKRNLDKRLLQIPVLGTIISKLIIARFSRTLSITLAAGLPLIQAIELAANITNNQRYRLAIAQIKDAICGGEPMQLAFSASHLFPQMVLQMIAIAEESGRLEQIFHNIADYYESEIDYSLDTLNTLIEPLIMSILGLIIGFLLLAMYIPIFKLGSVM